MRYQTYVLHLIDGTAIRISEEIMMIAHPCWARLQMIL